MANPRKRVGTLEPYKDAAGKTQYRGRIRLADGTRHRFDVPPQFGYSEERARECVASIQEAEDRDGKILAKIRASKIARSPKVVGAPAVGSATETCDAWYERFMAFRRAEVGSVDDDKWRWTKWVSPHLGPKPIRDVSQDDIENVRDALNVAVLAYESSGNAKGEGRLAPKTAQNVWTAVTTAFKYASTRKGPRELRVREDRGNPCLGIPPPRDGASKSRHWLRPGEILAVVSSPVVPRPWREAITIGCYLHLRPGELHELRVKDLDLVAGEVRICRAFDERKKVVKAPKTQEGIRTVTIPLPLMPLLERIAREGGAEDRVAPVVAETEEYFRAGLFRTYLKAAGVGRAELYVETPTHLMIDFRSLRDSGITWRFLGGERAEVVQRESGHDQITTTLGYAKEVSSRGGRFGEPFPSLPADLIETASTVVRRGRQSGPLAHSSGPIAANSLKDLWAQRDLNPRPTD
jgi:integrase